MCVILNMIVMASLGWELWNCYDVILDKGMPMKRRKIYTVKLISSCIITFAVLFYIYRVFGVTSENLAKYVMYGKV